ncbi:hypothetical protein PHMEG_00017371 [Phytophthora megakarya]|uniref:Uncharacterized protein n=1 Tax=Phytophthora megakarya TaxID=4795 RepID=A0A225VZ38_9STRA|nr:hypothetical protein PHMEG_00017371 [Phytophthora megakarya]
MGKNVFMSETQIDRIVQMRKDGVPVKTIAKDVDRSTNYIYRITKKHGDPQPQKKKVATVPVPDNLSDSSAALLCAVESMEVAPYEPIPIPRSVSAESRSGNTSVGFTSVSSGKSVDTPEDFWLLDAAATNDSTSRPTKKQKTLIAPIQSQMSIPLPPIQLQRAPSNENCGSGTFLKLVQDEIRRLEGLTHPDIFDTQFMQMLVKFHAELLLVQLQKTHFNTTASRANGRDTDAKETSRLLHEKLAKEIAVLNVQADRERLELEREQIKHKATTMEIAVLNVQADRERLELEREQIKHKATTMVCRLLNSLDDAQLPGQ